MVNERLMPAMPPLDLPCPSRASCMRAADQARMAREGMAMLVERAIERTGVATPGGWVWTAGQWAEVFACAREIAFACGYQSISGFSVAFARHVGCPPSHLRLSQH
jgi:AraC-like DNA-binding protein